MKTTIVLIRHGQTDWNAAGRWQGHTDIPLNQEGLAQARALAARLAAWPITAVYSSDLERARVTAEHLANALNSELTVDERWRERGLGVLEGLTREEVQARYPDLNLPRTFIDAPEGESYDQLHQRVVGAYTRLMQEHAGEMVAVVSHGGAMRVLISHILGLPREVYAPFSLRGNTGISIIDIEENNALLARLNDTSHLEGEPRTFPTDGPMDTVTVQSNRS